MSNYSLIFSQMLLLAISIYCIKTNLELRCPSEIINISYSLSGIYALTTAVQLHYPDNKTIEKIEDAVLFLIASIALPCLMVDIWRKHEIVSENLSFVHLYVGLALALTELFIGLDKESFDVIVGINVLALLVLSLVYSDLYSMYCSLLFIMGYFGCRQNLSSDAGSKLDDTFNYCLAGFSLCTLLSRQKLTDC